MGSIVSKQRLNKATGKQITVYRAHVRRTGFASKSKVFSNKKEAQDWLRNNDAESTLARRTSGKTVSELIEEFVAIGRCPYAHPVQLDFWAAQLGTRKVAEITHADIAGARVRLMSRHALRGTPAGPKLTSKPLSAATINRYVATASALFNFAMEHGLIAMHPIKGRIKKLKEPEGRTRILDADEEQRLYEAASACDWPMMRLYLRMLFTSGARRSEVLNLRWHNVKLDQGIAVLPKTKNGRARSLPLVSDVRDSLSAASKVRPLKADFVFFDPNDPSRPKNIDTLWRNCRHTAGLLNDRDDHLDRVVLHTTRHTAVTKMLRGGANLAQAARVSGHQTLAMLKKYEHLAERDSVELAERLLGYGSTEVR